MTTSTSTSNNSGNTGCAYTIVTVIMAIFLFVSLAMCSSSDSSGSSSSSKSTTTCPICHREFSDSNNLHSIRWNGMCEQCFKNYEYAQAMRGKDVYGNDLN